jgi:hypothetical protein
MGDLIQFPERRGGPAMFCAGCGKDRNVPSSAADPGPCSCGSTMRVSTRPPHLGGEGFFGVRIRVFGVPEGPGGLEAGSWGLSGGCYADWSGAA